MIRFLLERADPHRPGEAGALPPETIALGDEVTADLTVLDWLRLHRGLTGTKEGCGSGDCGACTVVIASPDERGELRHEAINACITFVGSLHGKYLRTVESLASGDALHPVQQAMLDEHGSQCGFCTPGFVMSLYTLYRAGDAPRVRRRETTTVNVAGAAPAGSAADRRATDVRVTDVRVTGEQVSDVRPMTSPGGWLDGFEIDDAAALSRRIDRTLGGNLCRCTGYRPIKRAALVALSEAAREVVPDRERAIAARLDELAAEPPGHAGFHAPRSVDELAELVTRYPDAPLLGGGTDLALEVTQKLRTLPRLIHTRAVRELNAVEDHGDALTLGAALSLTRCIELLGERVPGAAELLLRFGSDQVRNQGTIGGNIGSASPIGDLPPLLLALGATLHLQRGERVRELPLDDYFLGYRETALACGEFIRAVRVPLPREGGICAVHKVSKRMEDDISAVCGAFLIGLEGASRDDAAASRQGRRIASARIAFGGMAATPKRAKAVEARLVGAPFSRRTLARAESAFAEDFTPLDDARASADYRLAVARNLLLRVFLEACEPSTEVRLSHAQR